MLFFYFTSCWFVPIAIGTGRGLKAESYDSAFLLSWYIQKYVDGFSRSLVRPDADADADSYRHYRHYRHYRDRQAPQSVRTKGFGFFMFVVYILFSQKLNRYYIGQTADLITRLEYHAQKFFPRSYTAQTDDWELFLTIECSTRELALKIEQHIKRMKSKQYIENLKVHPAIVERLRSKYQ